MNAHTAEPAGSVPSAPVEGILDIVKSRGIAEVLHFTRAPGPLIGICHAGALLARAVVDADREVEHVYEPNNPSRHKDLDWVGYNSLSISRINRRMLTFSQREHGHEECRWVVLSFRPEILAHPGVVFATTNNTYVGTVRRGEGPEGLEDLFSEAVPWGWYDTVATRTLSTPAHEPTERQAEVLYPGALSLDHLQAVYVTEPEHEDEVNMLLRVNGYDNVAVATNPEAFL